MMGSVAFRKGCLKAGFVLCRDLQEWHSQRVSVACFQELLNLSQGHLCQGWSLGQSLRCPDKAGQAHGHSCDTSVLSTPQGKGKGPAAEAVHRELQSRVQK